MKEAVFSTILVTLAGLMLLPLLSGHTPPSEAAIGSVDGMAEATSPTTLPSTDPSGQTNPTREAIYAVMRGQEGFWRIAKDQSGVWWFVSPSGKREFLNTVTTVQPYQRGRDPIGPHFISRDWDSGTKPEGNVDGWAKSTLARVYEAGFKGLGAWSHPAFHNFDVPMTRDLNVWTWMAGGTKRVYSPDWSTTAERAIKVQVELLKDNKNLIGYYIDNEVDWGDSFSGPGTYFDHLPIDDPNRQEVIRVIQATWNNLNDFNADWNSNLQDWRQLDEWKTLPHEQSKAYGRLFSAWLSHMAEDYFRITTSYIRKYDPNHLILGVRFKGYAPLEVVRASKNLTDAQSLNYYVNDARLDFEQFKMMYDESGQPVVISEYSFHALDGRSGNRNTVGFAAQVLDQQARADGYHLFTTRLASVPYVIGADWFQWADEPPSGRSNDGEDVNFGVVDVDDRPYELLVDSIRKTTPKLNPMHEESSSLAAPQDIWRESFANKPTANVPYLSTPIRLNGELSDWVPQAKVSGMRHSQTIGLERSKLPLPNVYLGWTEQGLYMGIEVFDDDIQGAAANGWWWTRDHVEFWIATRPVGDQQDAYDVYSHQFFFVPNDSPNDGVAGTIGQWHRAGDSLTDNLIPHPAISRSVRILPDRYVVEMFIPAEALNGFDPANNRELAFNIHIRNFQHAIDYFWSAPKEVMTQLRPKTWGKMLLEPRILADNSNPATAQ